MHEGNSGVRAMTFSVTLSRPATTRVTVPYWLVGGSATGAAKAGPGVDFNNKNGVAGAVTFAVGTNGMTPVQRTLSVIMYGDTTPESDETFQVSLGNPTGGATLVRRLGTGTILDDDSAGGGTHLGVGDASVVEGNVGTGRDIVFALTLSSPATTSFTLNYLVTGMTAQWGSSVTPGADFGGTTSGTTTFTVGGKGTTPTVKKFIIPTWPDSSLETDETLTFTISAGSLPAGVSISRPRGTGTIIDDDGSPAQTAPWTNVVNDQFDSGGIPTHWGPYPASWASKGHNPVAYYSPSHCSVAGGYLNMLLEYEPNGVPGNSAPAWYSCTLALEAGIETTPDARVTLRWRLEPSNGGLADQNMPLRWPNNGCWPEGGEEDWSEGAAPNYNGASAFMVYGTTCSGGGWAQIQHVYPTLDLTQWHTYRFQRRTVGTDVQVDTFIDDMTTPTWHCDSTTNPACNTTTVPSAMLKHTVLQQEVPWKSCPDQDEPLVNGVCPSTSTPSYVDGTVTFQVDWITVDNPS